MPWMNRLRLRVLAYSVGLLLAALGVASVLAIPAWPVVGVAVAAAAVVIHRSANRLSEATCLGCGREVRGLPPGEHGVVCPDCGTISPPKA